jgi:hypothetical protein
VHCWVEGIFAMTSATWSPQPDQVIFPQELHGSGLHISMTPDFINNY